MEHESALQKSTGSELTPALEQMPRPQPVVTPAGSELSVLDYWRVLMKHKWWALTTLVVVTTLGALHALRTTPIYEASASMAVYREAPEQLGLKNDYSGTEDDADYSVSVETQMNILQGDAVARQMIRALQLDRNPAFVGAEAARNVDAMQMDAAREAALIDQFKSGLSVRQVPRTRLIEVRYASADPKLAAEIANTLTKTFIEGNVRAKYESTVQTSEWLSRQLIDLQNKVETSQEKLVKFQREHNIVGGDEKTNIITDRLGQVNTDLTKAESERITAEARYRTALTGNVSAFAAEKTSLLKELRAREMGLREQLATATVQFGPNYPKVRELENQLNEVQASLKTETDSGVAQLKSEYDAALRREKMLRATFETQKQEANALNQDAIEYTLLKREVDSNRELYQGLLTKLKEASISAGLRSNNLRLVETARVPLAPASPNVPRTILLSLMVGLVGGVGLAFLIESLDGTVRTPDEAQAISGLPALGLVPLTGASLQQRLAGGGGKLLPAMAGGEDSEHIGLITHTRPKSETAESYRALRTSILLSAWGAPPKVVLITSALPQEGKTTTATNTAIALSQQGARVLLVDCDLRRPSVHKALALANTRGTSNVLAGLCKWSEAIQRHAEIPTLDVLPAGPVPPHPAELLGSAAMSELLREWREKYDHIVLDTPPVLSVTDAVLLTVEADAVVLVIRSGQTSRDALRRANDLLRQVKARVMGVVLNAVDLTSPGYYKYYYYGSKYGGRYYDESETPRAKHAGA